MRGRGRHPHTGRVTPRGPIQGAQDPVTRRETVSSIADSSPATRCPLPARQCELRIAVAGSRTRVADPGTHVADPGSGVATANGVGGGNAKEQPGSPASRRGITARADGPPGAGRRALRQVNRAAPPRPAIPGFCAARGQPAARPAPTGRHLVPARVAIVALGQVVSRRPALLSFSRVVPPSP
jgi:hypothetical protein